MAWCFVLVVRFLGYDWKTSILGQIVHDLSKLIGQTPLPEKYNHTLGGKISRCILTMRRGTYGTCELVQIISLFRQGLPHLPVPIYVKTGIICNCAKHWPLRFQSISWLKTLTGKIWAISELRGCQNKNYGEHTNKRRRRWITLPSMSHRLIQPTFVKVPTDISLGTEFLMTLKHCWANGKECLI